MIRATKTTRTPTETRRCFTRRPAGSTRTLADILQCPMNPDEERLADEHIAAECERIQETWDDVERACRANGFCRRDELDQFTMTVPIVADPGLK